MCANPQTTRGALMYKSLAPRSVNSVRMPSYVAPLKADACFAESVSKTRALQKH
jgi:hypothetical protein